jgi:hypothetical protein
VKRHHHLPVLNDVWQINRLCRPMLSPAQIQYLAGRGSWIINAELRQTPIDREFGNGDCSVYAGQGVSDLDTAQVLMNYFPWGRFSVDVGGPDTFSQYVYIGTNDIIAWRAVYISVWGTVNRPQYWAGDVQTIPINSPEGTTWP